MKIDYSKIKPAHLLSIFGKQEPEEAMASALSFTGGDINKRFTVTDLGNKGWWITEFLYNNYIERMEDGSFVLTKKLIDFIDNRAEIILKHMLQGETYAEVLGLDKLDFPKVQITKEEANWLNGFKAHQIKYGIMDN